MFRPNLSGGRSRGSFGIVLVRQLEFVTKLPLLAVKPELGFGGRVHDRVCELLAVDLTRPFNSKTAVKCFE